MRDTVISSAARLNEVIRQSKSTVKTPSEMLCRMASLGVKAAGLTLFLRLFIPVASDFLDLRPFKRASHPYSNYRAKPFTSSLQVQFPHCQRIPVCNYCTFPSKEVSPLRRLTARILLKRKTLDAAHGL